MHAVHRALQLSDACSHHRAVINDVWRSVMVRRVGRWGVVVVWVRVLWQVMRHRLCVMRLLVEQRVCGLSVLDHGSGSHVRLTAVQVHAHFVLDVLQAALLLVQQLQRVGHSSCRVRGKGCGQCMAVSAVG
jgi:hypothetical protein